jgi:hypothetical protein
LFESQAQIKVYVAQPAARKWVFLLHIYGYEGNYPKLFL